MIISLCFTNLWESANIESRANNDAAYKYVFSGIANEFHQTSHFPFSSY